MRSIDHLLVFGGGEDFTRRRAVNATAWSIMNEFKGPVTMTGRYSGMLGVDLGYIEAERMRRNMIQGFKMDNYGGVDASDILVEDQGLDGLSCLWRTAKLWREEGIAPKKVGVVTDRLSVGGVRHCAKYMLGNQVEIVPIASRYEDLAPMSIATNMAVYMALGLDLRKMERQGMVVRGDPDSFDSYMETLFPFGPGCLDLETGVWDNDRLMQTRYGRGVVAKTSGIGRALGWSKAYRNAELK